MRTIYVDYENVQSAGLDGIDQLCETDKVILFYSVHAETMKIGNVRQMLNSRAEIEFVEAETGTLNALDFQLIAMLFLNAAKEDEAYIVSRDTGFDPAIHFGAAKGFALKRVSAIQELFLSLSDYAEGVEEDAHLLMSAGTEVRNVIDAFELSPVLPGFQLESPLEKIELIVAEKCGKRVAEKYVELIVTGLKKSTNKNQFYQFFRTNLGDAEGGDLYRSIRTKFEEMKGIV